MDAEVWVSKKEHSKEPRPPVTERVERGATSERVVRPEVAALDEILGRPFRVLDEGFVRAIDYMGSDDSIVQAARVSYGAGTKKVSEDRALIRYLWRHRHTTPFEMCEIKFHVRVPMDCWRQWIRHRTANVNEYSTRYSVAIDAAQRTPPDSWRMQEVSNRQGSTGFVDPTVGDRLTDRERELQELSRAIYAERLQAGVAREQARKDLPLSTYTEAYWKIDLHNLLHFLLLRMDSHAQEEIRQYATIIGDQIVAKWCPITWQAFRDYRLQALFLSQIEVLLLSATIAGDAERAMHLARDAGWLAQGPQGLRPNRERREFEKKLMTFGLKAPWTESGAN
jgi:thymidylate synthase (FAD)